VSEKLVSSDRVPKRMTVIPMPVCKANSPWLRSIKHRDRPACEPYEQNRPLLDDSRMTHAANAQRMSEMSVARMKTLNTRQGYRSVNNRRLAAPISTAAGYPRLSGVPVSARTRRIDGEIKQLRSVRILQDAVSMLASRYRMPR
jgi:hypothetical protein